MVKIIEPNKTLQTWKYYRRDILQIEEICFDYNIRASRSDLFAEYVEPNSDILLAEDHNFIVGTLWAVPFEKMEFSDELKNKDGHYGQNNTMYITNLAVLPNRRRYGTAKMMIKYLIDKHPEKRIVAHALNAVSQTVFEKIKFKILFTDTEWFDHTKAPYMVYEPLKDLG